MYRIKNYEKLNTSPQRKVVLDLAEAAFDAIEPKNVFKNHFEVNGKTLTVLRKKIDLEGFDRIFLLGFGKGSAKNCAIIEGILGDMLSGGLVIDVESQQFSKVEFNLGTHPLPSVQNVEFAKKVVEAFGGLGGKDLVIIVTCGGGSALLELPAISLQKLKAVNQALLVSGANIHDMNVVRKHLSKIKGGALAKVIHPASIVNLVFSDVPGNDLTVIASAPTVFDPTTKDDAWETFCKYRLEKTVDLSFGDFVETPKEEGIFKKVENILFLSNLTALEAMQKLAGDMGIKVSIYSDRFQSEAKKAGAGLIGKRAKGSILLAGGETTVKVTEKGEGGRNLELVLGALGSIDNKTVIASFDSDGWDNCQFAGAIADATTIEKARSLNLDPEVFLNGNDSLNFFKRVGDGIETGRLASNVSDLMIVYAP